MIKNFKYKFKTHKSNLVSCIIQVKMKLPTSNQLNGQVKRGERLRAHMEHSNSRYRRKMDREKTNKTISSEINDYTQ